MSNNVFPDDNRDRGILTKDDRKFLRGEKDFESEQSVRDTRYRIRKRVRNGLLDFSILLHHLDRNDREQIFEAFEKPSLSIDDGNVSLSPEEFQNVIKKTMLTKGISDSLSFVYLGVEDAGGSFTGVLESAISEAEEERGYVVEDVKVNIDVTREQPQFEDLIEKFEQGEPLSRSEISQIVRSGELDFDEKTLEQIFSQISEEITEQLDDGEIQLELGDIDEGDQE